MGYFDRDDNTYEVNPNLKKEIFSKIPANYSDLEQAIFIYNELCKKLTYSYEYYLNERVYMNRFTDPDNIKLVDGKENKDVVCYTFDRIFLKLLYDRELITYEDFWMNAGYSVEYGYFVPEHHIMEISIGGRAYSIDATMGIFNNSDISQAKFSNFKISGWRCSIAYKDYMEDLNKAIKKVQDNSSQLSDAVYDYVQSKAETENYKRWSLDLRTNTFLKYISEYNHKKDIQMLAYIHKLKHLFFTEQEYSEYCRNNTKVSLNFVRNTAPPCLSMFLFYNVEDKVKAYEVDLRDKTTDVKKITAEEFLENSEKGQYKYLTASRSFERMIEPVIDAANLHKKAEEL